MAQLIKIDPPGRLPEQLISLDSSWKAEDSSALKLWSKYRSTIYPDGLTPVEERECSLCYYAGMMDSLTYTLEMAARAPKPVATKLLERMLRDITQAAMRTGGTTAAAGFLALLAGAF
jgi:hypothetical protein